MIKKIGKVLIVLTISLLLVNGREVNAATAQGRFTSQQAANNIAYKNGKKYYDNHFQVRFNYNVGGNNYNREYEAYCIDPGWSMTSAYHEMTCTHVRDNAALQYAISHLTGNHLIDQLVLRLVAIATGETQSLKMEGLYLKEFITDGTGLAGDTVILAQVNTKFQEAMRAAGNASPNTSANKLQFTQTNTTSTATTYTATYNVSTNDGSNLNGVSFTCEDCTVVNQSWNGTNGTVTVQVSAPNCEFTIGAYYNSGNNGNNNPNNNGYGGLYICSSAGLQQLVVDIGEDLAPVIGENVGGGIGGNPTQTFTGRVQPTDGSYYATYCSNSCNSATTVDIPTYCDDDKDQKITITGPSNVQACVLGKTDESGASYQDTTAVSASNPYCAVYCKEDYQMTLPGAQYTTSGKYFELKNTTVTGTRSCYLAGPNGESSGVDLAKYRSDVIEAQKRIVTAYNRYSELKALYDNRGNATETVTKDCDGNEYKKYTLNIRYATYALSCNASTGKCSMTRGSATTSATWGKEAKQSTETKWKEKQEAGCNPFTNNNIGDPNYGKYQCRTCSSETTDLGAEPSNPSTADLDAARNALTSAINSLKQCYNWNNNFCFEPEVEFDYNEQYNSNINFGKVAGSDKDSGVQTSHGTAIDSSYNTNGAGNINESISYVGCDSNGCNESMNTATGISTNVTHVKKVVTKSAEYNNLQNFQTHYPSGAIANVTDQNAVRPNYSYLGAVFPVALKTTTGVYNWTLNFKNIGQYNNEGSCRLGRLNQVATSLGKVLEDNIGYVCVYVVDCDDCDYGCECPTNLPDGYTCEKQSQFVCKIVPEEPEPKCDDCKVYCVGCIFNGDDTYMYRTVSLPDINPTKRPLGANWTNEKGVATKNEIESMNEQIYIEPEYSYRMTPEQQKKIRDYNKEKGTYIADDLTYHKLGEYNNAYGTSTFLDNGQAKGLFTELERNTTWTLWTGAINTEGQGFGWK